MLCPLCNIELAMSERQGIEIDYCPQCRGVWLDRGELDKIIERSSTKSKGSRKEYRDNYHESHHYNDEQNHKPKRGHKEKKYRPRRKKRESILEEIFDIFD